MTDAPDPTRVLRTSHERFRSLVEPLDPERLVGPSYDDGWSIADVASHLGSQAEIFEAFLAAGLEGNDPPGNDSFPPIWDRWNAMPPEEQVATSLQVNEDFVSHVESLSPEQKDVRLSLFGMDSDVDGLVTMRISEHAVHTWDVAVVLDPTATVAPDAVTLLVGMMPMLVTRGMKPVPGGGTVTVRTTEPEGTWVLDLENGALVDDGSGEDDLRLSAEAFLRLVYGRLDPADDDNDELTLVRQAFPGV